mgnify:CR=1 FL=1
MILYAAYRTDGTITNAVLVRNSESPGKPKKAEEPEYMEKFIGTSGLKVPVIKSMLSPRDSDAVTGASITFMGVSGTLRAGSLYIMTLGGQT